jgi:hypothetical protein
MKAIGMKLIRSIHHEMNITPEGAGRSTAAVPAWPGIPGTRRLLPHSGQ